MTREQIIQMAREAGFTVGLGSPNAHKLQTFAGLVAAAEREACAKVCEEIDREYDGEDVLATWCAQAIRARGQA